MRDFSALDGRIRGVRFGRGRPVLALHGLLDNAMSFQPLGRALDGIELWAIDLPGHGLSAALPAAESWSILDWLPTLGRLLDDLGWERFDLVGHSLGGILAQMLATLDGRIDRLVALDALGPLTDSDAGNLDRLQRHYDRRQAAANGRRYYAHPDELWRARLDGMFPLSERSARLLAWRGVGYNEHGWFYRYDRQLRREGNWRLTESQVLAQLARLRCPLHLALFDDSPLVRQGERLTARQQAVPELHSRHFAGGHHAHMESPEPIARWLESVLR